MCSSSKAPKNGLLKQRTFSLQHLDSFRPRSSKGLLNSSITCSAANSWIKHGFLRTIKSEESRLEGNIWLANLTVMKV
jgi:hypothetical protein